MKIRTLMLAATIATMGTGFAFTQSAPAPANQSGGGTSATSPAPTDPSTAGQTGNTKGEPARATTNAPATTGSGVTNSTSKPTPGSSMKESQEKNASPASPAEGVKKEK
jgi:hypothetical protein